MIEMSSGGAKMKKLIIAILGCILGIGTVIIYMNQNQYEGSRFSDSSSCAWTFEKMHGKESVELELNAGDEISVSFDIAKGNVNLWIGKENQGLYKGDKIDQGDFTLVVKETGTYTVSVEAKHAQGIIQVNKKD